MEWNLQSRFSLLEKIGNGHFGNVYIAENKKHQKVAIKIDTSEYGLLRHEAKIINYLTQRIPRLPIPHIFWFGNVGENSLHIPTTSQCMAMTWFNGGSLKNHIRNVHLPNFMQNMLSILQQIHEKYVIHRDIKPENIVLHYPPSTTDIQIQLIDFGLATFYIDGITGNHIPENIIRTEEDSPVDRRSEDRRSSTIWSDGGDDAVNVVEASITGSPLYASIYTHQGIKLSRRDDCIQLGYVYLYMLLEGHLPWEGITTNKQREQIKREYVINDPLLASYMERCMRLKYDETPDYLFI